MKNKRTLDNSYCDRILLPMTSQDYPWTDVGQDITWEWCKENCKNFDAYPAFGSMHDIDAEINEVIYLFETPEEAILFKLKWGNTVFDNEE
jgi:hypothetical protein